MIIPACCWQNQLRKGRWSGNEFTAYEAGVDFLDANWNVEDSEHDEVKDKGFF